MHKLKILRKQDISLG